MYERILQTYGSILEIPRYLMLCIELIKAEDKFNIHQLSRYDLFELFIKHKLNKDKEKLKFNDTPFVLKILSQLALIMEIKQVSQLNKKDFTIIIDDIQSDIKNFIFPKIGLDNFFKYTVLKDNDESFEFENQEFQEYLAANEMISFGSLEQVVYDLCYIPEINILNYSWYNTLSFILEKHPELFRNMIMKQISDDKASENFFSFILSNITQENSTQINSDVKIELFNSILIYHKEKRSYLPFKNGSNLAFLYFGDGNDLFSLLEQANIEEDFASIANILKLFPQLCEQNKIDCLDKKWGQIINDTCKKHSTIEVVIQFGLPALAYCKEEKMIVSYDYVLDNIKNEDNPFLDAFFRALIILGNKTLTVKYVLNFYSKYDLTFRTTINSAISIFNDSEGILKLMKGFAISNKTLLQFLNASRYQTKNIIDNTKKAIIKMPEILDEAERIITNMLEDENTYYDHIQSDFIKCLCECIIEKNPNFPSQIIDEFKLKERDFRIWDRFERLLPDLLNSKNIESSVSKILQNFDKHFLSNVFYYSKWTNPEIYKIRSKYIQDKENEYKQRSVNEFFREKLYAGGHRDKSDLFQYYIHNYVEIKKVISEKDLSEFEKIIKSIFDYANSERAKLASNNAENDKWNFTPYSANILHDLISIVQVLEVNPSLVDIKPYRKALLYLLPSIHADSIYDLLKQLKPDEINYLKNIFLLSGDNKNIINLLSFTTFVKKLKVAEALPILKEFIEQRSEFHEYKLVEVINTINEFEKDGKYFIGLFGQIDKEKQWELWSRINAILIESFANNEAVIIRCEEIKDRIFEYNEPKPSYSPHGIANIISNQVSELRDFQFARPLMQLSNPNFKDEFIDLLDFAICKYAENKEKLGAYSRYIEDIVFSYFDNLKITKSYKWLTTLEEELDKFQKKYKTEKSYEGRLTNLRRNYVEYIEKSQPLTYYIKKYNDQKSKRYIEVYSENDLFNLLKNAIDIDLRKWVEIEGAYKMIQNYQLDTKIQTTENLMQRTLVSQFENILLKRGLRGFDIFREVEMLDGDKIDFLIKYGFIGSILIEIKLSKNSKFNGTIRSKSVRDYKKKLCKYLAQTHSCHGFYIIFNDSNTANFEQKIEEHKNLYKDTLIKIVGIDCMIEKNRTKDNRNV